MGLVDPLLGSGEFLKCGFWLGSVSTSGERPLAESSLSALSLRFCLEESEKRPLAEWGRSPSLGKLYAADLVLTNSTFGL